MLARRMTARSGGGRRLKRRLWAAIAIGLSSMFSASALATQNIEFVGQLDPVAGTDIYGDVWGEGHYAYVGVFSGTGVFIIDISDPTNPILATTYSPGSGQFKDVKVYDGVGYFATDNGGGVHIVDLSTPTSPTLMAQIKAAQSGYNSVHNLSKAGDYLYITKGNSSTVKVFDVSTPASPFFVRDIVTPDTQIHDVTALGTRLYASGIGLGFSYIYDVSTIGASAATLLGTVPTGPSSHASWVSSDETILISAQERSNGQVKIFDISTPASPVLMSTMDRTSLSIDAYSPHNVVLASDTLLFISWYEAGVIAIDISDPANPHKIGEYDTFPGGANFYDGNWGVYPLLGLDRVLLSDLQGGLIVVDATGLVPEVPGLLGPGLVLLVGLMVLCGAGLVAGKGRSARFGA